MPDAKFEPSDYLFCGLEPDHAEREIVVLMEPTPQDDAERELAADDPALGRALEAVMRRKRL